MTKYFVSDLHLGHETTYIKNGEQKSRGIIDFERTQFNTIQEHDKYILQCYHSWMKKLKPGDEFWNLGDFGDISYLPEMKAAVPQGVETHFLYGNHDKKDDIDEFKKYFDYVHLYPVYISKKIVVSHEPVAVWDSQICIHGHLHGMKLAKPNYINASVHVANYHMISEGQFAKIFAQIPKFTYRFLYEPYRDYMKLTQPKDDVIVDRDGIIDVSASRLLMRLKKEERDKEDSYQPYIGEYIR